jgi:hypothetical protein
VSHSESVAYQFEGRSGQKFELKMSPGVCVWLYTEDTTLVTNNPSLALEALPQDGLYLLQVSAEGRRAEFELTMAIEPFDQADFPQLECGDRKPGNSEAYPVTFYPVNIPYSANSLAQVQSLFCRDAYKKRKDDRRDYSIQVASFLDREKAAAFSDLLDSNFDSVTVAKPTILEAP